MTEVIELQSDIRHLQEMVKSGFEAQKEATDKIDSRIAVLNGTVRGHTLDLVRQKGSEKAHDVRILALEDWRTTLMSAIAKGAAQGVAAAMVAGGILFGIGKAAGWW